MPQCRDGRRRRGKGRPSVSGRSRNGVGLEHETRGTAEGAALKQAAGSSAGRRKQD